MDYEVIVIGGGHAGVEAASACARMGCRTAMVTIRKEALGRMSCNPAVGGIAKGQLVKEVDALGGEIGRIADLAAVQFRALGRSKGPAMWSPRAQCDRKLYNRLMCERIAQIEGLDIIEGEVKAVKVKDGRVKGVKLSDGEEISAKAVIIGAGTFLEGRIYTGREHRDAGRWGEPPSKGLAGRIVELGFDTVRLKTGTPPRLVSETIDYNRLTPQAGDEDIHYFSLKTKKPDTPPRQLPCHQAYTNGSTMGIIRGRLDEAPLYDGTITGIGPRYCPSIETKAVNFPDRERHLLFVEPEGWDDPLVYLNGFATSMPEAVQIEALHTIEGLENAEIARPGYAIEYQAFPPHQVKYTLETRLIEGLYFAGQIIGTSGYEEAAALGIMAGINAALKIRGEQSYILDRSQAYIGVMIDDLIIRGAPEPYRMFTSRAEYRLLLRADNADERLAEDGRKFGLLDEQTFGEFRARFDAVGSLISQLNARRVDYGGGSFLAADLVKRPELTLDGVLSLCPSISDNGFSREARRLAEIRIKYEGYINRQRKDVERFRRMEEKILPAWIDYDAIVSLSYEGRQRLKLVRPRSLGAAFRLFGVTPADIASLAIFIRKHHLAELT